MSELDTFAGYIVTTDDTPDSFIIVVCVVVVSLVAFAAPFGCWSREFQQKKLVQDDGEAEPESAPRPLRTEQAPEEPQSPPGVVELSVFHNEHLNAMKQVGKHEITSMVEGNAAKIRRKPGSSLSTNTRHRRRHPPPVVQLQRVHDNTSNSALGRMSNTPSAATTSRIYGPAKTVGFQILKSTMPWRRAHVLPRTTQMKRSLILERQSVNSGFNNNEEVASLAGSAFRRQAIPSAGYARPGIMSDAAGSVLSGHSAGGEAEHYRRRHIDSSRSVASSKHGRNSISFSDVGSVMPPLHPDAVSPEDAADAGDPGRILPSTIGYRDYNATTDTTGAPSLDQPAGGSTQFSGILDLADPDFEFKRLMALALPSTISAIADPLFRIALAAIISRYINTESMAAYLLVVLFLRLSVDELSGAISDAESNIVQYCLMSEDEDALFQAGRTIQLAVFTQMLVGVFVLILWHFVMDDVVLWLIDDASIAEIAADYTEIIMIDYVVKGASRSFMLPYYLTSQAQFEAKIDLTAVVLTFAAILILESYNENISLVDIGWVQVCIGLLRAGAKILYVFISGFHIPFKQGLIRTFSLTDSSLVFGFLMQALPLFLGSLLELGEWEILVLMVSHLGGPEVITWVMMGMIWEIFVGLTEGLGEAASVRVSYYLSEGMPQIARRLTNKVVFLSFLLVLFFTSLFLIIAPCVAKLLTDDSTLQHLFSNLVGLTSVASVSMTFSQIYWSLAGAQGRFALASATILFCRWFIILPMAAICIFHFRFDLVAVAGTIAIGNAVAAFILAYSVFRSDWREISSQQVNAAYDIADQGSAEDQAQQQPEDGSPARVSAESVDGSPSSDGSESEFESSVGFLGASVTERLNDDGSVFSEQLLI